ncbi:MULTISPECIES: DUF3221 domain-containing protein [Pontibacillus]|uniref:DUF3221 domain-containing protein n=1 Tax=Pontibacillus chungwhensis TaxID=265426 RepID=A0ABY8V146_9BACI|nr:MULTISPECIES: DUF3221 domain-containing protein [Pontibacillus]MCD5324351.1 YobA family protein [Pontibacillus sp. HN14]WIF99350.1 DUF3221 domain-containing protein [Pontibacillus chungwhensis]
MFYRLTLAMGLILLILGGCSSESYGERSDIAGYVMEKKGDEILVVSPESEDLGGNEEFYDAVWAKDAPNDIKVGDRIALWFKGGLETSYPGQATVGKIELHNRSTPKDATISEGEALRHALDEVERDRSLFTVQSIKYDQNQWSVILKDTKSYETQTVTVEDEK